MKKPLLYSYSPKDRDQWPPWYVWTGGWYESDGETNYYLAWDKLPAHAVVFDIGMYEGGWIERMNKKRPDYQFYGFEPAPRAFKMAKDKLSGYKNMNLYDFGLGVKPGTFKLYKHNCDSATFLQAGGPAIDAEIVNISQFIESENIQCVDLAAINIEGMEFELLQYMIDSDLIHRFKRLMLQWHLVMPDAFAIEQEIQTALAKTHHMTWNLGAWEAWETGSVL